MSDIIYRLANYAAPDDQRQILGLYREVFHTDFTASYDMWFCDKRRKPIGIVAVETEGAQIVGHWASAYFEAMIAGDVVGFRQSLGVMTDAAYRNRGIAAALFRHLQQALEDAHFIIGFPNESSYRLHIQRLDFVWKRDYHFVVLPRGCCRLQYQRSDSVCSDQANLFSGKNCLLHSTEYMEWHYQRENYEKWLSEKGHLFISVRYMDKADIVYWSPAVTQEDLLDFSAFLYANQSINRVTTWNSTAFLNAYPAEKRNYHMCIQYLNCTPAERKSIGQDWLYYMGDCDLY